LLRGRRRTKGEGAFTQGVEQSQLFLDGPGREALPELALASSPETGTANPR
jgi:hypothetical protein